MNLAGNSTEPAALRHHHATVLERLPQAFEGVAPELRELVQEEDSVVAQHPCACSLVLPGDNDDCIDGGRDEGCNVRQGSGVAPSDDAGTAARQREATKRLVRERGWELAADLHDADVSAFSFVLRVRAWSS